VVFDLVLHGGWVVDGTGAPPWRCDVAVTGERIAALGPLSSAEAAGHIDVTGRYLTPGFVDTHVHADAWRGLTEVTDIAHRSGVAAHVSHLHGPAHMITSLLAGARHDGADLTFDSYPYLRGSTILAMVALPLDVQAAGPDDTARSEPQWIQVSSCVTWLPQVPAVPVACSRSPLRAPSRTCAITCATRRR
jgi:adenine deaminase